MPTPNIRFGTLDLLIDGEVISISGGFTMNLGTPQLETVVGMDRSVGFKVTPRAAFIEGNIFDHDELDVERILTLENVIVQALHANGKMYTLRDAAQTGSGDMNFEDGTISVRFDGVSADAVS